MIGGLTLVLGLPLLAAAVAYLLRRWSWAAAGVAALVSGVLAWITWHWPAQATVYVLGRTVEMGQPLVVFGQVLKLTPAAMPVLSFTCLLAGACFIYAWRVSQGRSFFPFGLGLLAVYNAALSTQPLIRAPLLLALAATLAVYVIQAGRPGSTRGALRWLIFPVLALPFFMVAVWYLDQVALNPNDVEPFAFAARLMAFGLLLLLMAVPLHGAVTTLVIEAPPLVSAFLLLCSNALVVYLLNGFLRAYPWLAEFHDVSGWLLWLGLITAGWAGLLALGQRSFRELWGYAVLFNYGCLLAALGLGAPLGLPLAVSMFIARAAGMVLAAMGLSTVRHRARGDSFESVAGVARRLPWSTAGLLAGGLAMVGFPLTVGFPSQWALLQLLAQDLPLAAIVLFLGGAGVVAGYVRGLQALLGSLPDPAVEREPRIASGLVALLLSVCVLLCLRPQLLTELVSTVTAALGTIVEIPLS
ncbi:MAG TPA: proton-conducting transporter membrane subunit [Anaerolineae bacterium]|nr:proton-conducting transporter membrane subunit [Anaerolineae bacterium]